MKILIPLFFTLLSISSAVPVLDTDGDQVRPRTRYIIDLRRQQGGSVTQRDSDMVCPRNIVVGPRVIRPEPASLLFVTFQPANGSYTVVHQATPLNIEFVNVPQCIRFWEVQRDGQFVTTGDVEGILPVPPPAPRFKFVAVGNGDIRIYYLTYGDNPVEVDSNNRLFVNTARIFGPATPIFQLRKGT